MEKEFIQYRGIEVTLTPLSNGGWQWETETVDRSGFLVTHSFSMPTRAEACYNAFETLDFLLSDYN